MKIVLRKAYYIKCSGYLSLTLVTQHTNFFSLFPVYSILCQIVCPDSFAKKTKVCDLDSANNHPQKTGHNRRKD